MPLYKRISKYFIATILMGFIVAGLIFVLPSLGIVNQPSADGTIDSGFDNRSIKGSIYAVTVTTVQNDGKILVGGGTVYNGESHPYLLRINTDGSTDNTFSLTGTGLNGQVRVIVIQSDGKILIGGSFTTYNGVSQPYIARLNSDGSLDTSFIVGTGFNSDVYGMAIQSNGKIMVGGYFISYNGVSKSHLVRLESDGTLDTSFTQTGIGLDASGSVWAILIQSDGKIIVGGRMGAYDGSIARGIVRFNSDGTRDNSFNNTTSGFNVSAAITSLALQSDGKVIVGGMFTSYKGNASSKIVRINTDGTWDDTFVVGTGFNGSYVNAIKIQSDGKILVGGDFTLYNGVSKSKIVRLNTDGSLDATYVQAGVGLSADTINHINILSNGNALISAGASITYNSIKISSLFELKNDGSLDNVLTEGSGFNGFIRTIQIDNSERILVGGSFNGYNGISQPRFARLNTDGSLDTTFVLAGTGFNSDVGAIAVQDDDKILAGGYFTTYNGNTVPYLLRFNDNGSLDSSFTQAGTGLNGGVTSIIIQEDNKIVVGGSFTSYNGISTPYIARLNTDGSLDTSFVVGTGFDSSIYGMVLQSDGKILAGGSFTTYKGSSAKFLIRLNSDGSSDNSFIVGTGFNNQLSAIALGEDGKIFAVGYFSTYKNISSPYMACINPDGSRNDAFVMGTGFNALVSKVATQNDGKVIVGGNMTSYNGVAVSNLVRLNIDGSLDSTFVTGTGFNSFIYSIKVQSDSQTLVGGNFSSYNGLASSYITRLDVDDTQAPTGSIIIAGDASSTSTNSVSLSLGAQDNQSGVSEMMICNDISFAGCTWESFSGSKAWTLDGDSGTKTVYVKFKDGSGVVSSIYSDSIVLALPVVEEDVVTPPSQTSGTTNTYSPTTEEPVVISPDNDTDEESQVQPAEIKILNESGTPIVGARVEIDGKAYITDSNGAIMIANFNAVTKYIAKVTYKGKIFTEEILGIEEDEKSVIIDVDTLGEVKDENIVEEVVNEKIPWYYYVGSSVLLSLVLVLVLRKRNRVVNQNEFVTKDIQ